MGFYPNCEDFNVEISPPESFSVLIAEYREIERLLQLERCNHKANQSEFATVNWSKEGF